MTDCTCGHDRDYHASDGPCSECRCGRFRAGWERAFWERAFLAVLPTFTVDDAAQAADLAVVERRRRGFE